VPRSPPTKRRCRSPASFTTVSTRTTSGTDAGAFCWKNDGPRTPFGKRRSTSGRSAIAGSSAGATRA
jgi:hypothetical protein